jgi:hypothetical protein
MKQMFKEILGLNVVGKLKGQRFNMSVDNGDDKQCQILLTITISRPGCNKTTQNPHFTLLYQREMYHGKPG